MTTINKSAIRAAISLHGQLMDNPRYNQRFCLPEYAWNNIQRLRRQIDMARGRGWRRAAASLTGDLASQLDNCRRELENACRALQTHSPEHHVASVSDIYRDIVALYDEFEDVEINSGEHTLSVKTDCIDLEDIRLGRFEIQLECLNLGESQPYRVVALDPNPAARRDDVTHPHVQDESLCEGEGRTAIAAALAEGRFYDFFMLVSQILHNYGRGSAYVELSDWDGVPCDACGATVDEDSRYCCESCGDILCGDCVYTCHDCDNSFCGNCVSACADCDHDICPGCLQKCSQCGAKVCENCCEDGICRVCRENNEENQSDERNEDNESAIQTQQEAVCGSA